MSNLGKKNQTRKEDKRRLRKTNQEIIAIPGERRMTYTRLVTEHTGDETSTD